MRTLIWNEPGFDAALDRLYQRPGYPPEIEAGVARIIADVRENGDEALARYALQFDRVKLTAAEFAVTAAEVEAASAALDRRAKRSIREALRAVQSWTAAVSWGSVISLPWSSGCPTASGGPPMSPCRCSKPWAADRDFSSFPRPEWEKPPFCAICWYGSHPVPPPAVSR